MIRTLLEFDDAGAGDTEPAKGVTVGDIRAWHDQYQNILASWAECRDLLSQERAARITGAADIVDEAACLIWLELCPDTIMSDEDRTHYEAAAKAVLALSASRNEALEAALREAERFVSYLANETDGHFVGSGTPTTCLVMIRAALAPQGASTREAVIEEVRESLRRFAPCRLSLRNQ